MWPPLLPGWHGDIKGVVSCRDDNYTKMCDLAPDIGSLITGGIAWQRGHITGRVTAVAKGHTNSDTRTAERLGKRKIGWWVASSYRSAAESSHPSFPPSATVPSIENVEDRFGISQMHPLTNSYDPPRHPSSQTWCHFLTWTLVLLITVRNEQYWCIY